MLSARDIMTKDPITVTPETDIMQAAKLLLEKGFNGLPVVDEAGDLKGVLCQSDLISQQKTLKLPSVFTLLDSFFPLSSEAVMEKEIKKMTAATVADAMSPEPVTVDEDTSVEKIATIMSEKKLFTLPVLDKDGRLCGVVGKEDVLRTLMP